MGMVSGFFNAKLINGAYDNVYDAEDFANYFRSFISDGVFAQPSDQLKVVPKSGLTLTVKPGKCYIKGYWGTLSTEFDVTFTPNTTGSPINCVVACVLNPTKTNIDIVTKQNVSTILRDEDSLVLASFTLNPGVSTITTSMITDRRPDNDYCGFVTGVVKQINYQDIVDQTQAQFNEWFDDMKDQLSTDAAGNLQQQIDNIMNTFPTKLSDFENDLPDVSQNVRGIVPKPTYYDNNFSTTRPYGKNVSFSMGNNNGKPIWIDDGRKSYQILYNTQPILTKNQSIQLDYVRYGAFIHMALVFKTESLSGTSRFRNARSWCIFLSWMQLFTDTELPGDALNLTIGDLYSRPSIYVKTAMYTTPIAGNSVREKFCSVELELCPECEVVADSHYTHGKRIDYMLRVADIKVVFESGFTIVNTDYKGIGIFGYVYGQNGEEYYNYGGYAPK